MSSSIHAPRTSACPIRIKFASKNLVSRLTLHGPAGRAETVNSARYTETLRTFLEPELQSLGVETQTLWFQQDGATAHTAKSAMRVLNEMFPARMI